MWGKSITLFKMFGFSVRIDLSWLIILVLVVWSLAGGVFPQQYPGLGPRRYMVMAVLAAIGLFGSIVVHELCHSLVARLFGIQMKGITLFVFGGVAEMHEEPPSAKAEFYMASAGPLASAVIAAIFLSLAWLGRSAGWPTATHAVIQWIGFINGILVAFNLIPGFPLDGGRVLRSALWAWKGNLRWATHVASQAGAIFGMALVGLGFLSLLMGNPIGGLWWILIGMFLRGAAKQSYQQVVIRQTLKGEPVSRFMNPDPVTVPPSLPLSELVNDYVYRHHYKMFPVVSEGRLVGCISTRQVHDVPRQDWPNRTVGDVTCDCGVDNVVSPDEDAVVALSRMNRLRVSRLMVVQDSRLVGIVSLKDLLRFLSLKLELESEDRGAGLPLALGEDE